MIFLNNSNATIRSCRVVGNRATFGGGGTYIRSASPTFVDVTWENNQGGSFGGAIDMFTNCNPTFTRCVFRNNTANRAGGVEVFGNCQPTFTNCEFVGNAAGGAGGGALLIASTSTVTLRHCTIVGNTTTAPTSSAILTNQSTTRVFNSIVYFNTSSGSAASQIVGTTTSISYSCMQGGFTGAGNITADPLFVNRAAGDLRLTGDSACIDASNAAEVGAGNAVDLRGLPRRVDAPRTDTGIGGAPLPDMGAHEFQPAGCDDIDFNNNEVFPEDQDVIDFFNVLAGAECTPCNDIDFNNNSVFPEDQDVIDFFNVLAGGQCP
jgi:hypothetical protein